MNPYLRWAILLLVVGGLAYYYTKGSAKAKIPFTNKPILEKADPSLLTKKLKQRKPKRSPEPTSAAASGSPTPTHKPQEDSIVPATAPQTNDEGMSNAEFAKQFSKVREGNAIATGSTKKPASSPKPAPRPMTGHSTSASSLAGAEADDDMSPIASPVVKPAGDVSDMLEAPAPGASVLRLTGSVESDNKPKNKKSDGFKAAETKKQRQQRLKRESAKLRVQEAEKERRVLLEKQLHTARDFERKEAKSKHPTSNAWTSTPPTNGVEKPKSTPAPLLDTFVPENKAPPKQTTSVSTTASQDWTEGLPSEEEQIRLLSAGSSGNEWTTVSNKKKDRRRATNTGGAMSDTSSSETHIPKVEQPAVQNIPVFEEKQWTVQPHPEDSDWQA